MLMQRQTIALEPYRYFIDSRELAKVRHVNPGALVPVYLGLRDQEKTLDWLEKC